MTRKDRLAPVFLRYSALSASLEQARLTRHLAVADGLQLADVLRRQRVADGHFPDDVPHRYVQAPSR